MRNLHRLSIAAVVALSVVSGACAFDHSTELIAPTGPDGGGGAGGGSGPWAGLWTSDLPSDPGEWTCGAFQWDITEETPTSIAGSFFAICGGMVTLQGTGAGQLNGIVANLSVNGQATIEGVVTTCPFSIAGTGVLVDEDSILVNYAGTTCFGPVEGSETLQRP